MKKRFVFAAACILAFPFLFSLSQDEKLTTPTPFATVALAGRTIVGTWCDCGAPGCLCEPGEDPGGNIAAVSSNASSGNEGINQSSTPDVDLASGVLTLALVFLFWLRMR